MFDRIWNQFINRVAFPIALVVFAWLAFSICKKLLR